MDVNKNIGRPLSGDEAYEIKREKTRQKDFVSNYVDPSLVSDQDMCAYEMASELLKDEYAKPACIVVDNETFFYKFKSGYLKDILDSQSGKHTLSVEGNLLGRFSICLNRKELESGRPINDAYDIIEFQDGVPKLYFYSSKGTMALSTQMKKELVVVVKKESSDLTLPVPAEVGGELPPAELAEFIKSHKKVATDTIPIQSEDDSEADASVGLEVESKPSEEKKPEVIEAKPPKPAIIEQKTAPVESKPEKKPEAMEAKPPKPAIIEQKIAPVESKPEKKPEVMEAKPPQPAIIEQKIAPVESKPEKKPEVIEAKPPQPAIIEQKIAPVESKPSEEKKVEASHKISESIQASPIVDSKFDTLEEEPEGLAEPELIELENFEETNPEGLDDLENIKETDIDTAEGLDERIGNIEEIVMNNLEMLNDLLSRVEKLEENSSNKPELSSKVDEKSILRKRAEAIKKSIEDADEGS